MRFENLINKSHFLSLGTRFAVKLKQKTTCPPPISYHTGIRVNFDEFQENLILLIQKYRLDIMLNLLNYLILFMFVFSKISLAQEKRQSDFDESLLGIDSALNLSEDVEGIAQKVSDYRGQFSITPIQADQLLHLNYLQNNIDIMRGSIVDGETPDCPPEQNSLSTGPFTLELNNEHHRDRNRKRDFRISLMVRGNFSSAGMRRTPYDRANFDNNMNSTVRNLSSQLDGLSLNEAFDYLMKNGGDNGGAIEQIKSEDAWDSLLRHMIINSDASDRMSIYQAAGEQMSFDRQVQFIAKLGGSMAEIMIVKERVLPWGRIPRLNVTIY